AFLRAVRPEVTIHAAVDRFAVFIQPGAPGVVPHAAPVLLLFVADEFGNGCALFLGRLESAQLGKAGGTGANNGNAFLFRHVWFTLAITNREPAARIGGGVDQAVVQGVSARVAGGRSAVWPEESKHRPSAQASQRKDCECNF